MAIVTYTCNPIGGWAAVVEPEYRLQRTYFGSGNLLAQTAKKGSARSLSVTVNPAMNRVVGLKSDNNGNQASWTTPLYPKAQVYFGGMLVIGQGDRRLTIDRLGSTVRTEGYFQPEYRYRYYPYGEQQGGSSNEDQVKFGTYWRDSVSGLDYAQNRYFAASQGRFTSADPYVMSGGMGNPQGWNRYGYVGNDPINFNDPTGLQRWMITYYWSFCSWYASSSTLACSQFDTFSFYDDGLGGRGDGRFMEVGGSEGPSSSINKGNLTLYDVVRSGSKFDTIIQAFNQMKKNLTKDSDYLNWFAGGTRAALVVSPELFADIGTRIGVASRFEMDSNNAPGIAAVARPSAAYDIVINGQGGLFYGGDIPGLSSRLSASSDSGRIFVLLHELAHVVGGLINDDDADFTINANNNTAIWQHCQKAVMGGN
jgi:RHS repeat-associated protein